MQLKKITLIALVAFGSVGLKGQVCFNPVVNYSVGPAPQSVCSADFNGDGKLDLVTAISGSNYVTIQLGTGTGLFGTVKLFAVNTNTAFNNPVLVKSSDFNGDGKLDLVTGNINPFDNSSILLGTGTGSFGIASKISGFGSISITISDFNGDGKLDLAGSIRGTNDVSVLLGTGTGSFGTATNFSVDSLPWAVTSADFNGDGKSDLATANSNSKVSILLGDGTGNFGVATNFSVGSGPWSIISADFNGDGKMDLATANLSSNDVSILLGNGIGSFGASTNFSVGTAPCSIISADFNGDSKLDLAIANRYSNNVSILFGIGTGSFSSATNFSVSSVGSILPLCVISDDFNGDGKPDVATANYYSFVNSILLSCSYIGFPFYLSEKSISIYPNPANTEIFIEGIEADKYTIDLFDLSGRLLLSQDEVSGSGFQVSGVDAGIYNLCIKTSEGSINKKLVIVR